MTSSPLPSSTGRVWALLGLATLFSCSSPPRSEPISEELALETFEATWSTVGESHFDPTFNGVDWDALHDELEPQAREAGTQAELRGVLDEMLGRLDQSHFVVIPAAALPTVQGTGEEVTDADMAGDFGFDVRLREGELLVTDLRPGGPAAGAGVELGWTLVSIGGFEADSLTSGLEEADERLLRKLRMGAWARTAGAGLGSIGSQATLTFLDREDEQVTLDLVRDERDAVAHTFGALPTFYLHFSQSSHQVGDLRVGRVHFTNWFMPMVGPIHAALEGMRDVDGVIVDLRGNTGGAGAMVMGVAGHFFDEITHLGTQSMREGELNYVAMPRQVDSAGELLEPYRGPVVILIDETTGSASEVFAGGLQSTGRVHVIGETSAGAVLPATFTKLPNGDALLHAFGDFKTADGTLLEGQGVIPDQVVPMTRAGLRQGVDPQLAAALDWIVAQNARP